MLIYHHTVYTQCFNHVQTGPLCLTHHTAGKANPPQPRADVVPHTDAAPTDSLSHRKLQEEQRNPNQYEQDEIGHQICSCQSKQYEEQVK